MITIPAALQTAMASGQYKMALLVKVTRTDGVVEYTTTTDQDQPFGGHTYVASAGIGVSDIENTAALAVNNADLSGFLSAQTKADIRAGVYDFAQINVRQFNAIDITQGSFWRFDGWLGELSADRLTFKDEMRSLVQALSRTVGYNVTALCSARLGDARCGKDMSGLSEDGYELTATGTVTGVSPDRSVIFDTGRTEPGPAAGPAISNITNAKPGVVTLLTPLTVPNGTAIIIYGETGMLLVNTLTIVRNRSASGLTFELGIDTSDTAVYSPYLGGGHVAQVVDDPGYFAYGEFMPTSGLAIGRAVEVKASRPGMLILQEPVPFAIAIGDTYTVTAGCNKLITTCRDKFDNVAPVGGGGFRGFPYVPGQDKMVQVGRKT